MTIVDIANLALTKIGSEASLTSLDDKTKSARLCKLHIDASRRSVLCIHPWKFAKARVSLTPIPLSRGLVPTNPAAIPAFGPAYAYIRPADCVKVRKVNDLGTEWLVEGEYILCDASTINLQYTADITDANKFFPQFCDVMALHLASKICYALTQSNDRDAELTKQYAAIEKRGRFADSTQDSPVTIKAELFDGARLGPNRGFVRDPMT